MKHRPPIKPRIATRNDMRRDLTAQGDKYRLLHTKSAEDDHQEDTADPPRGQSTKEIIKLMEENVSAESTPSTETPHTHSRLRIDKREREPPTPTKELEKQSRTRRALKLSFDRCRSSAA